MASKLTARQREVLDAAYRAYIQDIDDDFCTIDNRGYRQADSLIDEKYPLARDTANELVDMGLFERDLGISRWWYRLSSAGLAAATAAKDEDVRPPMEQEPKDE